MAGAKFSLSSILNWLQSFLNQMTSPISGYNIQDAKVKDDGDAISVLYQFNAGSTTSTTVNDNGEVEQDTVTTPDEGKDVALKDIKNNDITLNVLLKAVGVHKTISPLYTGMNQLTASAIARQDSPILDVLLGEDWKNWGIPKDPNAKTSFSGDGSGFRSADELLALAENAKSGLLGVDFKKSQDIEKLTSGATFKSTKWSWYDITNALKCAIECQTPGKDYGAIDNQEITNCGNLIAEYLTNQGIIQDTSEVNVSPYLLALPIIIRLQATLKEYFTDAYKKYVIGGATGAPQDEEPESDTENNPDADTENTSESDTDVEEDLFPDGEYTGVDQAKHIDVTLQKITGTTSFNMTMIRANYDPSLVLSDMDEIVGQPEFIESLPEDFTSYSIDVDDDGFDIESCEECIECNPCESLCEVFKSGIRAYRNLYILHWMSSGNDMMKLHNLSEEMYGELFQEIDTIGELLVEKQGTVPQLDFACDYIPVQKYDFQTGLDQIKSLISMYIDCIDYAYCNQDSDVQSMLDEWLRYWNKQLDYFVKGQET